MPKVFHLLSCHFADLQYIDAIPRVYIGVKSKANRRVPVVYK